MTVGDTFTIRKLKYTITDPITVGGINRNTVEVSKCSDTSIEYLDIPREVKHEGNIYYVETIVSGLLSKHKKLKEISVPFVGGLKRATSYGDGVKFGYIFGGTNNIPNTLKRVNVNGGFHLNGDKWENIPQGGFVGCGTIEEIYMDDIIHSMGTSAFKDCANLKYVRISTGLIAINNDAFQNCTQLKTLKNINKCPLTSGIALGAFHNCGIEVLTLPSTLGKIGNDDSATDIFDADSKIKDIYYLGTKDKWNSYKFHSWTNVSIHFLPENNDTDFLAFTFDGQHSLFDLNIYRTIDGDRFMEKISPTPKDLTAEIPGGDGTYFFGTHHPNQQFTIKFAFESLTEAELLRLKRVYQNKKICDLIFDERPYKVYSAKITGDSSLNYIPFSINGKRVYRGEGQLQFTCYWPYAHTPINGVTKVTKYREASGKFQGDGRLINSYSIEQYPTKTEWEEGSGLTNSTSIVKGDVPAHFVYNGNGGEVTVGNLTITAATSSSTISWDSKTGLVKDSSGNLISYTGNSCGVLPVGTTIDDSSTVTYCYWYY